MRSWNKSQWEAFGRHIITALSAVIATLVMVNLVKAEDAAAIISSGTQLITALVGLAAIVVPVISGFWASATAAPEAQALATVKNLEAGVPLNGKKDQLINAIAEQPEVKKVELRDPAKADSLPSNKVV